MNAKKILAGACASIMLAVAAAPVVSAADSVKVTVGSAEAKAGDKFTVNIDLADIPAAGINGCDFGIKYDSSVITINDLKLGELAKEEDALDEVKALEANLDEAGLVSVLYGLGLTNSANYLKDKGTFLVVSGTVNKDAAVGKKSPLDIVAVDRLEASDSTTLNSEIIFGNLGDDGTSSVIYDPKITPGEVTVIGDGTQTTVEPPTTPPPTTAVPTTPAPTKEIETLPPYTGPIGELKYGDVNLDNAVTNADTIKLIKYQLNGNLYPVGKGDDASIAKAREQADVKKDGKLDTSDTIKLNEYNLKNYELDQLGTAE